MVSAGGVASRQTLLLTTLQASAAWAAVSRSRRQRKAAAPRVGESLSVIQWDGLVMVATITDVVPSSSMQRVSSSARAFRLAWRLATWLPYSTASPLGDNSKVPLGGC